MICLISSFTLYVQYIAACLSVSLVSLVYSLDLFTHQNFLSLSIASYSIICLLHYRWRIVSKSKDSIAICHQVDSECFDDDFHLKNIQVQIFSYHETNNI